MKKNISGKLAVFLFVLSVVSYFSVFISPANVWPVGFLNYCIPVLLSFQVILLVYLLLRKRKLLWWPVAGLLLGYYFLDITFNFPTSNPQGSDFEMLSFNARLFRERKSYSHFNAKTIEWAVNESSAIKCFQEFSTEPLQKQTDVIAKMEAKGYESHTMAFEIENSTHAPGLAIFSRFPIVNRGAILLNPNSINNCIFADIAIKGDTIRVYNFHLQTMGIRLHHFKDIRFYGVGVEKAATRLGSASSKRAIELRKILDHAGNSPHPFLFACDFNELIYGNNYYKVRKVANDTFEKVGNGFGFTFNSILFFIRLDHQFFSKGLEATDLEVLQEIKSSDHFPLKGYYKLHAHNSAIQANNFSFF